MLERLMPHQTVGTVYEIDLEALRADGVTGIITDLDNTLVGAKVPLATPELIGWLDKVRSLGFRVVIVSNNNVTRVSRFADPLGIPYIHAARKPRNRPFQKALDLLGLQASEAVVVGDQMLTDVLGGKRMGLHTILVTPIAPTDEGLFTRINRFIERIALRRLRRSGLWPKEDNK